MGSLGGTLFSLNLEPGTIIAGRYEVLQKIGSGGMGMVFRVKDRELRDELAVLKLLHPHLAENEEVFKRFLNEVLVARSLSHPNIVRIHDIGKSESGFYYISMEYVDGFSLKDRIDRKIPDPATQLPLPPLTFQDTLTMLFDVANGVAYAHERGIIHRDLKPANVLISQRNEVKLADFGTARIVGGDTSLTQAGQVIGTPDYMSPEQIRGEALDAKCDIYSLGIMAYELATGKRPFVADAPVAVAFKHLSEPLPPFASAEIPEWFDALVHRCAAKKKEDRPDSVLEFIATILEHQPNLGSRTGLFNAERFVMNSSTTQQLADKPKAVPDPIEVAPAADEFNAAPLAQPRPGHVDWKIDPEELRKASEVVVLKAHRDREGTLLRNLMVGSLLIIFGVGAFFAWTTYRERAESIYAAVPTTTMKPRETVQPTEDLSMTGLDDPDRRAALEQELLAALSPAPPIADPKSVLKSGPAASSDTVTQPTVAAATVAEPVAVATPSPEPTATVTEAPTVAPTAVPTTDTTIAVPVVEPTPQITVPTTTLPPVPLPEVVGNLSFRLPAGASRTVESGELSEARWNVRLEGASALSLDELARDVKVTASYKRDGTKRTDRLSPQEMRPDSTQRGVIRLAGNLQSLDPVDPGEVKIRLAYKEKSLANYTVEIAEAPPEPLPTSTATTLRSFPPVASLPPAQQGALSSSPGSVASGLPPAVGSVVSEPTVAPEVIPPAIQESYGGLISIGSNGPSRQGLVLDLSFQGDTVSGTATLDQLGSFQVQGKVLARGLELFLRNETSSIRLTSGPRGPKLRGTAAVSGQPERFSWEASRR